MSEHVHTADPDVHHYEPDPDDPRLVESVTVTTDAGDDYTFTPDDAFQTGDGHELGYIDRIAHHPGDDSSWTFTVYLTYTNLETTHPDTIQPDAAADTGHDTGGLPLGELCHQLDTGDLVRDDS